jgi:hypothetical protein
VTSTFNHIPERRKNWAEAELKGKAKSVITPRGGHVMIADEPLEYTATRIEVRAMR